MATKWVVPPAILAQRLERGRLRWWKHNEGIGRFSIWASPCKEPLSTNQEMLTLDQVKSIHKSSPPGYCNPYYVGPILKELEK